MEKRRETSRKKRRGDFELCRVCNLNHDQGRGHKYFPAHKKALSLLFSRFKAKVSEVSSFIRNPAFLRSDDPSRKRLWCVFCDSDINEVGSTFACCNSITHLASKQHFHALKGFIAKYGSHSDELGAFIISQENFMEWQGKCKSLRSIPGATTVGAWKNIHNDLNHENREYFDKKTVFADVFPSPYINTGRSRSQSSSQPGFSEDSKLHHCTSGMVSLQTENNTDLSGLKGPAGRPQNNNNGKLQCGTPPLWLEQSDGDGGAVMMVGSSSSRSKLNPKRVGAAWAESRRHQMEMEKQNKSSNSSFGDDWLPDFGNVWESGSTRRRYQSMGKFMSHHNSSQPADDVPILIQPYIPKRMRIVKHDDHVGEDHPT